MVVYPVTTDADGVGESLGRKRLSSFAGRTCPHFGTDMLFQNSELGPDTSRLAHIKSLRQSILCPDDIFPKPQSLPAVSSTGPGRFCLHPIEERQTQLLRA